MTKADLRKLFLAKRKALSPKDVAERSEQIAWHFFDFLKRNDFSDTSVLVHIFLPIERQNEVDTWLIIKSIWADFPRIQLAVSVTDTKTYQLNHYPLNRDTQLQKNRWGIPEPIAIEQMQSITSNQFDIILVPLLVFDKQSHRVGYGKGYYDRFLAECRPDCLTIGLSLFEPIDVIDDIQETDIPLGSFIVP
ncbi:5-formyltetrahydrofolate cyclo-ligase [Spirosoma daeguense]